MRRKKNACNVNFNVTAHSCIAPHLHLCCRGILIYGKNRTGCKCFIHVAHFIHLYTVHGKNILMVHIKHSEMRQQKVT